MNPPEHSGVPRIEALSSSRRGQGEAHMHVEFPDAIAGGTWEALERLLRRLNYFPEGLPKIAVARKVSEHMDPERNRSKSFQVFRDGLLVLVQNSAV
jgi:hypothetical protein